MAKPKPGKQKRLSAQPSGGKKKTSQFKAIKQATFIAFGSTICFVLFLVQRYHSVGFSTTPKSSTDLLLSVQNVQQQQDQQKQGNMGQRATSSSFSSGKQNNFKEMFDKRLNSWKPAIIPQARPTLAPSINNANPTHTASKIVFKAPTKTEAPTLEEVDYDKQPESMDFIFHNKLPKSGSSTMNGLLRSLARRNGFNYQKLEPVDIQGDKFDVEVPLVRYLKEHYRPPYFLLKHHFFFNFTKYEMPFSEPTYVNVIRDPLDWFVSHYYFERFGWARKQTERGFRGTKSDLERTVDECVRIRHPECVHPPWKYVEFICGTSPLCQTSRLSTVGMQRAVLISKRNVATRFYMVGILEQFDDTLKLFEKMLPKYYGGAYNIYNTDEVQKHRNQTKTVNRKEVLPATREFFMKGPLRYAFDLYEYSKALFNERLRRNEIEPMVYPEVESQVQENDKPEDRIVAAAPTQYVGDAAKQNIVVPAQNTVIGVHASQALPLVQTQISQSVQPSQYQPQAPLQQSIIPPQPVVPQQPIQPIVQQQVAQAVPINYGR